MEPLSAASVHLARLIFLMAVKSVGHRAGMDEGLEGWSGGAWICRGVATGFY